MSNYAEAGKATIFAGQPVLFMAYVRWPDNLTAITQATTGTINYTVTDRSDGSAVASGSLTVADVIDDDGFSLDDWTRADSDPNFRYTMPGSNFPDDETEYEVKITFTPSSGAATFEIFHVTTREVHG